MDSKESEVRTRFAPAPTGLLHIGGARTCLFNYLFAKKQGGVFILRIEDTDAERSNPEYEKDILEGLKWLKIEWDEGPAPISQREIGEIRNPTTARFQRAGSPSPLIRAVAKSEIRNYRKNYLGDYGPYRQSERLDIYTKYLKKLLEEDRAYYCFCSEEELEAQKQEQLSIGEAPRYSKKCANLSKKEVQKLISAGKPAVIRFRTPAKKIEFDDLIRGKLEFDAALIGDIVIAKTLTTPLYNFACAVDDFETKISHVIRGEEHISNTPKQILFQEALNFPSPQYAHLPIILAPDRTKLSKRHGATGILEYRKEGYLPEALVNFIAFLGWNPGGEREIYSMPSLIKEFSIEKVQKGGAVFNIKRLDFLNSFYIRHRSIEKLTELCLPYLIEAGLITPVFGETQRLLAYGTTEIIQKYKISETGQEINLEALQKIISLYQERLKKLSEIQQLIDFFFKEKLEYEKDLLKWPRPESSASGKEKVSQISTKEIEIAIDKLEKILSEINREDWNKENLEKILMTEAENFSKGLSRVGESSAKIQKPKTDRGYLLWPLRVALSGKEASAGPFEIAEVLGKEKTLKRIKEARGIFRKE